VVASKISTIHVQDQYHSRPRSVPFTSKVCAAAVGRPRGKRCRGECAGRRSGYCGGAGGATWGREGGREYGRGRGRGDGSRGEEGAPGLEQVPARAPAGEDLARAPRRVNRQHHCHLPRNRSGCGTNQAAEPIRPRPRAGGGAGRRARLGGPHPRAADRADGVLVKVDKARRGNARRRLVAHLRSGGRPSSPRLVELLDPQRSLLTRPMAPTPHRVAPPPEGRRTYKTTPEDEPAPRAGLAKPARP